jgi:sugar-specific transcriptional regulator TrmB
MNPYSGLVEFFEAKGLLVKQGNRLKYVTKSGEEMIEFRKNWTSEKLDTVMNEWNDENLNDEKHELEQQESEVENI